jgi:uncharacterized membrane protein
MKKAVETLKRDWLLMLLILLGVILGLSLYPMLPGKVPILWSGPGQVSTYGTKLEAAFGVPFINLIVYLAYLFMVRMKKDSPSTRFAIYIVVILLFIAQAAILFSAAKILRF